jgi:META domain
VASTLGPMTSPSRTFRAGLQLATACLVVLLGAPAVAQAKPRITKGPKAVTPGEKARLVGKRFPSQKNVHATVLQTQECAGLSCINTECVEFNCTNPILDKGASSRDWTVDDRGRTRVRFRWPHGYLVHDADFAFVARYPWLVGEPASVRICSAPGKPRCAETFVRIEQPPPTPLSRRPFISTAVTENGAPRSLVPGTRIEVRFMEHTLTGQPGVGWRAGCNTFGSDVEIAPDRLILGDIGGTAAGCPSEDLHEQDDWLARFFDSDPRWRLNDRLVITSDGTVITLEASPG